MPSDEPTRLRPRLWPIFHTCGAVALYSKVPIEAHTRVPAVRHLVLADGRTPLHSPFAIRSRPKAPNCPSCGETTNRQLRSQPILN